MINTALILAGGLGTRLRPLTDNVPKPLLPLKNKPILEYLILNLKRYGVENILISIGYKADLIQDYFQDGSRWGVKITYSLDGPEPIGTGGSVKLASSQLREPFFLLWGDNLMDLNLKQLQETHFQNQTLNNTLVTMTLTKREDTENFGVVKLDGNKIISFVEKPSREDTPSNWINAGAFVIEPKVLDLLPAGKSSIEKDCFEKIAKENQITAYFHRRQWFPTDTLEKYQFAAEKFDTNPIFADPNIFKAYDIRGEWNSEWEGNFTYALGLALVDYFHPKVIAIGRDMRNSSEEIFQKLSSALCSRGCRVKDLGLCGTELTYFAASFDPEVDLALMITASHNPGKDNGLKITLQGGIAVGLSTGLDKIRDLAFEEVKKIYGTEISTPLSDSSLIQKTNLWQQYREHVIGLAKKKHFPAINKIVIDAGNGTGGYMLDQVFSSSPMEVIKLFWDPNGNFPNHPADPFVEKNVDSLKQKVVEEKAALGIALDGDSDRLFVIDENGRYIPGYYLTAILTDFILSQTSSPKFESIAYDPRYYRATVDVAAKYGAKALPSKAGHTLIKAKMRQHHCIFSAECSGHIFYRENNYAESSMLTLLLVLQLIEEKGPLSFIADHYFQNYPISGEINFIVENPAAVIEKLKETYADAQIDYLDGISIEYADWRCNVRSSNTQPLLRLNVEARNQELVQKKVAELKQIIGGKIAEH